MDWTRGSWISNRLKISASASTEANWKQGGEFEEDLEVRQQTQEIPDELESRKRTLTLNGFEYQEYQEYLYHFHQSITYQLCPHSFLI